MNPIMGYFSTPSVQVIIRTGSPSRVCTGLFRSRVISSPSSGHCVLGVANARQGIAGSDAVDAHPDFLKVADAAREGCRGDPKDPEGVEGGDVAIGLHVA